MPSLSTRANNEYINQDELAKRIAFERTISQVNKYYGDEKEVSIKPGQLTSQLKYGFDSLFENFRNAIEQILSEEYNGDLLNQKSYEVIKKYNQLSSYLKNIINMKQLSDKDQEEIEAKFIELKPKLELLRKIAVDNEFFDNADIVDMVDKINKTTSTNKEELKAVPATSEKMVKTIENKSKAEKMIHDGQNKLDDLSPKIEWLSRNTKSSMSMDFNELYLQLGEFFKDPSLNPREYDMIKSNYDALQSLYDNVTKEFYKYQSMKTIEDNIQ